MSQQEVNKSDMTQEGLEERELSEENLIAPNFSNVAMTLEEERAKTPYLPQSVAENTGEQDLSRTRQTTRSLRTSLGSSETFPECPVDTRLQSLSTDEGIDSRVRDYHRDGRLQREEMIKNVRTFDLNEITYSDNHKEVIKELYKTNRDVTNIKCWISRI